MNVLDSCFDKYLTFLKDFRNTLVSALYYSKKKIWFAFAACTISLLKAKFSINSILYKSLLI
ncbi:hypothetical protein BpHYR1_030366 [Brachionus plicatilis]|uniref:Uncharacterized protein n=1 Tax=Brachionus plicatilis TaxID=10195 RepID=A0A3M7QZS0_BRAPC|nr:hypothetical protein BpHYR1_030366 [Brachionus plicatilis]